MGSQLTASPSHFINQITTLQYSELLENYIDTYCSFFNIYTVYLGKDSTRLKWSINVSLVTKVLLSHHFSEFTFERQTSCHAVLHNVFSLQKQVVYNPLGSLCKGKRQGGPFSSPSFSTGFAFLRMGPSSAWGYYLNLKMIQLKAMELQKHFLPSSCSKVCM